MDRRPSRRDRDAVRERLDAGGILHAVDCRRRGAYAGASELVRAIARGAGDRGRVVVERHALTLLSIAPEIAQHIHVSESLARSFTFSREGNSRFWTLRLAHGLVEFLLSYFAGAERRPVAISFDEAHAADSLDQEFLAVLLRRADPAALRVIIGTSTEAFEEPLRGALHRHARLTVVRAAGNAIEDTPVEPVPAAGEDVPSLAAASVHYMRMAYYEASLDSARRGLALLGPDAALREKEHGDLSRNALFALLLLDRLDEVKRYCSEIAATSGDPALRSHAAYALAILYARAYPEERRDYARAKAYVEEALGFAERVPDSETRTVNLVFLRNTLALVEMRLGRPERSLELLTEGLERLEREAPSKCERESIILLSNRARLNVVLGDPQRAIEDYTALLEREPSNSEAHLDRGILYHRAGRLAEALDDYDLAIRWSPPYDEVHFNRAQILAALGRKTDAIAALDAVLALEPEHRAALVNRAGLLFEQGRTAEARADVERALRSDARDPKAWCLRGLIDMAGGRLEPALEALSFALECDEREETALVNRATALCKKGDHDGALRDLGRALSIRDTVTARCNRARIFEALGRWQDAIDDYSRALELAGRDVNGAEAELGRCRAALAARDG